MMHFQLAGSGVMSAFYPHESELSRRVKQLIRAAKKQLEALIGFDPKRDMPFKGTRHNALDDAIHQAKYVSAIWKKLAK